jgi:hypothetical protein
MTWYVEKHVEFAIPSVMCIRTLTNCHSKLSAITRRPLRFLAPFAVSPRPKNYLDHVTLTTSRTKNIILRTMDTDPASNPTPTHLQNYTAMYIAVAVIVIIFTGLYLWEHEDDGYMRPGDSGYRDYEWRNGVQPDSREEDESEEEDEEGERESGEEDKKRK